MYAMHVMYAERGASSMDTFSITAQTFVIVGRNCRFGRWLPLIVLIVLCYD